MHGMNGKIFRKTLAKIKMIVYNKPVNFGTRDVPRYLWKPIDRKKIYQENLFSEEL